MKKFFSKNLNRAIVFLCLAALLTGFYNQLFRFTDAERTNTVLEQFYELEDDSVECIFFGSSVAQRDYVTPVAYHDYGIPAYQLASGTQPFILTKYLMIEALKTQSPKLFVIELKGVNKRADWVGDVHVRRIVDNMKPSKNRYDAINAILSYVPEDMNGIDSTGLSYYFPLIKYHSQWNPSLRIHNYEDMEYYTGFSPNPTLSFRIKPAQMIPYDDHTLQIDPPTEEVLIDLLDFCDTLEDTEVLFVIPPYQASADGMGKMNYAKKIVEERGYEVLNLLPEEKREEIGLDDRTCYYDREHLTYYGALLYTDYFFNYIKENYGLEDVRDQGGHEAWEDAYDRLMNDLETRYAVPYGDMMEEISRIEKEGE